MVFSALYAGWAQPFPADGKAPPSALGQHRSLAARDSASRLPRIQLEPPSPALPEQPVPLRAIHCRLLTAGADNMCAQVRAREEV